ncbi:UPF0690 protein C1orf52 homolog [Corythoichthys intestinalis]|uniref:UPF0690 protein C1orf52 homolog n=1 Tax=Corythoichthys intestinalis TaxID=161448 RepID=UPI0025A55FB6|nr:UPF0690 protein C1orf52 homolog [Corythoichthys intestinalis]XP_061790198.1 UPF0690 protein C1orf52 homolog [Nerophis lumbriciformis]
MTDDKTTSSLGFFSSYDDLSDSSASDEEASHRRRDQHQEPGTDATGSDAKCSAQGSKQEAGENRLPKPDELFNSVSKPAFLYNPLNKEIDWDNLTVKPPEEAPREFKPWVTNAVPPPQSYATEPEKKKGPPPGMDMAIKWSNVYEDNGEDAPKAQTGKAQFLPPEEQHVDSDEESKKSPSSAKKRRVESFQQKEKRKRDMGQATSDKSFVEEEKRILRQKIE